MAIEEIGSEKERQARLRRKKETLGMDETMEVRKTHGSASSGATGSADPIPQPVETSIAQRSAPDLVLWNQLRKRGKPEARVFPPVRMWQRKPRTSSRTRVSATGAATACKLELRTIHITDNHTMNQSSDHHGRLLFCAGRTW